MVRQLTPLVYRLAFRMLRSAAEAEDASQEVFVRMHRSIDSFDPTRPLAPWVGRITYHVCLRRLQSAGRRAEVGMAEPEQTERLPDPHRGNDPELRVAGREAGALLERALSDLSAQDRALLDLRYREGMSDAEVAEATGMPVGTVKTRIFRARARLREQMAPHLETS